MYNQTNRIRVVNRQPRRQWERPGRYPIPNQPLIPPIVEDMSIERMESDLDKQMYQSNLLDIFIYNLARRRRNNV